ncbi:hypothetical protein TthHB5018_b23890 (plasmid) [Thermus thermophilus]|uniref:Uncharacterized protein n=1 Tax=Thermus thermophilus TaxID=274 RepID=A0A7R7TGE3_THETH|nr:hypothetical protein TthHB5018_b23890 [Thermus thermophilus]
MQPFKVGPDYIDPTHLEKAAARRPYNLDGFFLDETGLLALFRHGARGADFALIEGVMGLFDGKDPGERWAPPPRWLGSLRPPWPWWWTPRGWRAPSPPSPWASGTSTPGCGWWGSSPTGWARSGTRRS